MKKIFFLFALVVISFQVFADENSNLREERNYYNGELDKTKSKMFAYILNHKMATSAVIATGGGLGAFLQENMDEGTRNIVMLVGAVGLVYCIDNADNAKECASVTTELTSYAAIISNYENKIRSLDSRIASQYSPQPLTDGRSENYNKIRGSDKKGPDYHKEFPTGVYKAFGSDIKLIFSMGKVNFSSGKIPDMKELQDFANKAEGKLHVVGGDYYYTLLENNTLLVLKHSSTYNEMQEIIGTGMTITKEKEGKHIKVVSVLSGSPAESSGVHADDYIHSINGVDTSNMTVSDSVKLLKGVEGTKVSLLIQRDSLGNKSFKKEVVRSLVKYQVPQSVSGYLGIYRSSEGRYYYFRNDKNQWYDFPKGKEISLSWHVGNAAITINIVRPNANADTKDREVDYLYKIDKKT